MKLSLKSTMNTTNPLFRLFEENKYVFPIGRNLCLKQLAEDNCQFIPLCQNMQKVLDILPTSNRKHFVVAQLLDSADIHVSLYSIKNGERKTIKINNLAPKKLRLIDSGDSNVVGVWTQLAEDQHQVSLIQFSKMKVTSTGFLADALTSVRINPFSDSVFSISAKSSLRLYECKEGGLEMVLDLVRKFANSKEIQDHLWFNNDTIVCYTKSELVTIGTVNNEVQKTTEVCEPNERIVQMKRLGRCIVLFTSNNRCLMYLYLEERFALYQECKIDHSSTIMEAEINPNEDLIVVRTQDLTFFSSKVDDISQEKINGQYKAALSFEMTETYIGELNHRGVSICQTKPLVLFTQTKLNTIGVWNIDSHKCIIRKQFYAKYKEDNANILTAGAMHPNGYSIALAFLDRIRLYHLLLDDIKCFYELPNKRVKLLRYSHGGQFLCFSHGKGKGTFISVINTINMQQIAVLKVGSDVDILIWSQNDYELYCACDGFVFKWSIVDGFTNRQEIKVNEPINLMRFDFKTNRLLISCKNSIIEMDGNKPIKEMAAPISNFHFAYPKDGRYIFGDTEGFIYISNTIDCEKPEKLAVGTSSSHLYSKSGLLMHLSPETSEVIIIKSKSTSDTKNDSKPNTEEYVLVSRGDLEKNIDRLRNMEITIQNYHNDLMTKLQEEKNRIDKVRSTEVSVFSHEVVKAKEREQSLVQEKIELERMSAQIFNKVEEGQVKAVDKLERLYEGKLSIERGRVLNLQQKMMQEKLQYQSNLRQLEGRHQRDIEFIRIKYEEEVRQTMKEIGLQKTREIEVRKELGCKVLDLEQQNTQVVVDIQITAEEEAKGLLMKIAKLERDYDTSKADNRNLHRDIRELTDKLEVQVETIKRLQTKLEEARNRIACMEKQLHSKDELIKEKEVKLYQYEFKINELEKSKHVLSFRATEIRKELEPKESQIDKLKKELFKLEEQLSTNMKENEHCKQELWRSEKTNQNTKKELAEVRVKLKKKALAYEELTQDIFKLVNNQDPKEWNPRIVEIYQHYVGDAPQEDLKRKPNQNTAQEMNRHLIHLEKSLYQVGISNDRAIRGTEKEVMRKLKENSELLTDLNDLRQREKVNLSLIQNLQNKVNVLTKQLRDSDGPNRRADSAATGITGARRTIKHNDSLDTSFRGNVLDHRKSEYTMTHTKSGPRDLGSRRSNRILSANRTTVCRGSNYDPISMSVMEKNKMSELMVELENEKNRVRNQERIIDELTKRLRIFE